MRLRLPALIALCLVALGLVLPIAPAEAGGARFIQVEKVVTGPGTAGPFSIEVDCDVTQDETFELSDGESDVIQIDATQTEFCRVTELDAMGAEVSYECEDTNQGDDAAVCESGTDVTWEDDLTGAAVVVVTNAFPASTTSTTATTTTVPAAPAPSATPRPAPPSFTG